MNFAKDTILREDIYDYIDGLSYQMQEDVTKLIVSHNDIQEGNILSMRKDATKLVIIDYEYTSFGNREYDLAHIFNELCMDYTYPCFPFMKTYKENSLSKEEYEAYSKYYLELYHQNIYNGDLSETDYVAQELPNFLESLYCSMILKGINSSAWSILMLTESQLNEEILNYACITLKLQMNEYFLEHDFIKEAVEARIARYNASKN